MEQDYGKYTDEELIIRLREGDNGIMDFIMEKYKNMVRNKAKVMFILGADNEDLIQEGMIGLFKAIRDYDTGRDASFHTFADLCVSRQMYTAVRASGREKHIPLNTYVSLYAGTVDGEEDGSPVSLMDALQTDSGKSPEELLVDKESLEALENAIEESLSTFEKAVLDLYITGMRNAQISRVLGKDEKSTDNALQRVRTKMKKIVSQESVY